MRPLCTIFNISSCLFPFCLSVSLSVCESFFLSTRLSAHLSVCDCLSVHLSKCVFVHLSFVCLSAFTIFCQFSIVCSSIHLSLHLLGCLQSVFLSVRIVQEAEFSSLTHIVEHLENTQMKLFKLLYCYVK